jgi:hypothetical protein
VADPRQLIPATPRLLAEWCGPVLAESQGLGWVESVVLDGYVVHVSDHGRAFVGPVDADTLPHIRLDLARAEAADRAGRVLAEAVGLVAATERIQVPVCGYTWESPMGEQGWQLGTWNCNFYAWFAARVPDYVRANLARRHGDSVPCLDVPTLADLDDADSARLPDGARLVDRLALAAVVREVVRG